MIALALTAQDLPDGWEDMTEVERADYAAAIADADDADRWAEAMAADEPLDWEPLYRTIRAMGGINGLGQIAPCDIPGGLGTARDARGRLLRQSAAVPYDELPMALAAAGFGDWYADMTGDELLAHLWRAWDAWDAAQRERRMVRCDAAPVATAPVAPRMGESAETVSIRERTVSAEAARDSGPVTTATDPGLYLGTRPASDDAVPLPEPDAADVDAYELAALFGAIGEPEPDAADVREAAREAVERLASEQARQRAVRLAAARRAVAERQALDRAAAEIARGRRAAPRRRAAAPPPRLRVLPTPSAPPAAAAPSARAHAVMAGAIFATFATSAALLVALVASMCGVSVPGIVWPLALSLPAVGAGVLPVALRPWALPTVRVSLSVRIEPAQWRKAA